MTTAPERIAPARKWWICGLLLGATAVNYMDRLTLALTAERFQGELQISNQQYGNLELAFGWSFAAGSLLFGWLADRVSVARLYPAVLFLWSAAGFATGLSGSYAGLLVCRAFLGLFEAGHWPCALKTTQHLLEPGDRVLGNGVLQSGAALGSIATPPIVGMFLTDLPGSWKTPFLAVGAAGLIWIGLWLPTVRSRDLAAPDSSPGRGESGSVMADFLQALRSRKFLAVLAVVVCINTSWQLLRAWLPKFLTQGRGYTEAEARGFTSLYYAAAFAGCLGVGALTARLQRGRLTVHHSRRLTFLACSLLTASTVAAALLPHGWPLLLVLLLVGAGALGLFPTYYSWSQELSEHHQGKVTGVLSVCAWALFSPAQPLFGIWVDATGSYDVGLALAGCAPLAAVAILSILWR